MDNGERKSAGWVKISGLILLITGLVFIVYFNLPENSKYTFGNSGVFFILFAILIFFSVKIIVVPLVVIIKKINIISGGILPDKIKPGTITIYKTLITTINEDIDNRMGIIGETKKIKDGNFTDMDKLKDNYGQLGIELYNSLKGIEIHSIEGEKRNWTNTGLSKFGEYLRSSSDIEEVSRTVISNLVNYINAEQGMFYLLNEDLNQPVLKLVSSIGVENKTDINESIECGEGLVGQCWKDREHILINDAPEKYCTVKSGIGIAAAKSIIIIPLIHDNKVQGVLEIASLKSFPEHYLEFLFKLSESIASTLFNLMVSEKTKLFLAESQKRAQVLLEKENTMQQQIIEMYETQDEIERVKVKMNAQLTVFNQIVAISKNDLDGNITFVNDFMLNRTGYERHELMGRKHRTLESGLTPPETYTEMWKTITSGKTFRGEIINKSKDGKLLYNDSIVAPIKNSNGENIEYLIIRFPIDEQKKREIEMMQAKKLIENQKKKNEAILEGNVDGVISFNEAGIIQYVNKAGEEIMGADRTELTGTDIKELIQIEIDKSGQEPVIFFKRNNEKKKIGLRTELSFNNKLNSSIDILASLTGTKLEDGYLFTIFAQNITVDLF